MNDTPAPRRLAELDGLRGIAAVSVVLFHYTTNFDSKFGHTDTFPFSFWFGRYGVELFFMISGFVIFLTLDKVGTAKEFAFSRFSRLYPAYWVSVLITWLWVKSFGLPGREVDYKSMLINLSMVQKAFGVPNVDQVYWTLYAELGFYLIAGLLLYIGLRQKALLIMLILVAFNLLASLFSLLDTTPGLWRLYAILPLDTLYLFLGGVVLYEHERTDGYLMPVLAIPLILSSAWLAGGWRQAFAVLALLSLVFIATKRHVPILKNRFIIFLGLISYPLYLIHANIGYSLILHLEASGVTPQMALALASGLALFLATVISYGIEYPGMKMLRQWKRQRASQH